MLSRRSFFAKLAGLAVVAQTDPEQLEKLLWTPVKTIFVPPPPQPRSGAAIKYLQDVENGLSLKFLREYDIQKAQYATRMDMLYGFSVISSEHSVHVGSDSAVDQSFYDPSLVLSPEDFKERYLRPAFSEFANEVAQYEYKRS